MSELVATWREVIRRIEVIVTLERVSGGVGWRGEEGRGGGGADGAYKIPSPKTMKSRAFSLMSRCILYTIRIGSARIMQSVMMEKIAFAYHAFTSG